MKTTEYKLIPLNEITDEAREIAVAWCENYVRMGFDIQQKHKLASDIINYADQQVKAEREKAIDDCKSTYNSLWIKYTVNGLRPTVDEVLKELESLKLKQP